MNKRKPILVVGLPIRSTMEEQEGAIDTITSKLSNEYHVIVYPGDGNGYKFDLLSENNTEKKDLTKIFEMMDKMKNKTIPSVGEVN